MSPALPLTPARRDLLVSALRYGLAGVANTAIGLSIILALDLGLGLNPNLANAIGYAVGICVSFALSKLFVFRARQTARSAPLRYLVAVAAAFALNQGVLTLAGRLLPEGPLWASSAQALAVASYTAALFLLSHYWVFANAPKGGKDTSWTA